MAIFRWTVCEVSDGCVVWKSVTLLKHDETQFFFLMSSKYTVSNSYEQKKRNLYISFSNIFVETYIAITKLLFIFMNPRLPKIGKLHTFKDIMTKYDMYILTIFLFTM